MVPGEVADVVGVGVPHVGSKGRHTWVGVVLGVVGGVLGGVVGGVVGGCVVAVGGWVVVAVGAVVTTVGDGVGLGTLP